jgi:predicted YcjX-like family ATPase
MKIGITGPSSGGKTVFLSSLLWQLQEHNSDHFNLGPGVELQGFGEVTAGSGSGEPFPFEQYRDSLSRQKHWPEKTTDCYRYACEVTRSDWNHWNLGRLKRFAEFQFSDRQRLEFFDFPGERIADAAVAAMERYTDWSDHLFRHFRSHSDYLEAVSPYLSLQKQLIGDPQVGDPAQVALRIVHAYKLALAGLVHGYKPLISPSTFLLSRNGDVARPVSDEELATSRIAGASDQSQFAPLAKEMRAAYPALTKLMATHYRSYRQTLALPLFEEIGQSQCLVVLVDIPSILAGGVGRYNDNRQIVLDLFEALRPDSSIGARLSRLFAFWRGSLKKVAFVAAKADLVLPEDIRNDRIESLLRQMTGRAKTMLPDVEFDWFVCSAIHSTRAGTAPGKLIGRTMKNNPNLEEREFSVSALPEGWPADWRPGDYQFADVYPDVAQNQQIAPRHIGLDRLFKFLIGGKK